MKIMIGLSGGVDSAVAAYLLKQQGYELYQHCYDRGTFCNEETSDLVLPDFYTDEANYKKAFEVAGYLNEYFYNSMEYSENPRDRETIFQSRSGGGNIGSEAIGASNGYKCGTCPSQEMVDCYETINGQTILNLGKPYNDGSGGKGSEIQPQIYF